MAVIRQSASVDMNTGADPASATFDSSPVQGNLLVAVGSDRSGGTASNFSLSGITGWTETIQQTIQQGNSTYRRTHTMYWKVAGASESTTVTLEDGTSNNKYLSIYEYEFETGEDQWVLLDSTSNDNGTTGSATTISTGSTASQSGEMFIVASVVSKRGGETGANTFSWDSGLSADVTFGSTDTFDMDHGVGSDAKDTVTGTKSSTATLSFNMANTGLSAALLVFDVEGDAGNTLAADSGSYTYTGTAAELQRGVVLTGDSGTYTYTGTSADLLKGSSISADTGDYTYTGTEATLTFATAGDFTLTADSGSYLYSGTVAGLIADRLLAANTDLYTYTGAVIDLKTGFSLTADSGSYVYTGIDLDFDLVAVLGAITGSYVYNGTNANIFFTPVPADIPVAKGVKVNGSFGDGISVSATFGNGATVKGNL